MQQAPPNLSPCKRFANGISSAALIGVVLACGYSLGKRVTGAEAAIVPMFYDDESSQPASMAPARDSGAGQPASTESDTAAVERPTGLDDASLLQFNATAYCIPGYTAAGIVAHKGTIAADPRILPLGSVVHIRAGEYSGTYLVLDTGGKIKGRTIDIYVADRKEALSFGRRQVRLKVIGRVPTRHLQPK